MLLSSDCLIYWEVVVYHEPHKKAQGYSKGNGVAYARSFVARSNQNSIRWRTKQPDIALGIVKFSIAMYTFFRSKITYICFSWLTPVTVGRVKSPKRWLFLNKYTKYIHFLNRTIEKSGIIFVLWQWAKNIARRMNGALELF